jgi:hypothetical protein
MATFVEDPRAAAACLLLGSLSTAASDVLVDSIVVERARGAPQVGGVPCECERVRCSVLAQQHTHGVESCCGQLDGADSVGSSNPEPALSTCDIGGLCMVPQADAPGGPDKTRVRLTAMLAHGILTPCMTSYHRPAGYSRVPPVPVLGQLCHWGRRVRLLEWVLGGGVWGQVCVFCTLQSERCTAYKETGQFVQL